MNAVEDNILVAMHDRAKGGVHVESLLSASRQRGMRYRRRRRALLACGVASVVLGAAGAIGLAPWQRGDALRESAGGVPAPAGSIPAVLGLAGFRPPVAAGVPPLTQAGQVGADPRVLHLDVADPTATRLEWRSGHGGESLSVSRTGDATVRLNQYAVFLARTEAALDDAYESEPVPPEPHQESATVLGRPATLSRSTDTAPSDVSRHATVRWQPLSGVWAQVRAVFGNGPGFGVATERADILQAAAWVLIDRVYRCAVGFRLAWVPPAARETRCDLTVHGTPSSHEVTNAVRIVAGAKAFRVETDAARNVGPVHPNAEIAGRPVRYGDDPPGGLYLYDGGTRAAMVVDENGATTLSRDDILRLIGGFTPVAGDLNSWPDNPLA